MRALISAAAIVILATLTATPGAATPQTVQYTYDAVGRLTSAAYDGSTTIGYEYDASGNITRIQVDQGTAVDPSIGASGPPAVFALGEARPNPSPGRTTVAFQMPRESDLRIEMFDITGRRVRTLVRDRRPSGFHAALWDGRDDGGGEVASGVYFLRMQAGSFDQTRRLVVIK